MTDKLFNEMLEAALQPDAWVINAPDPKTIAKPWHHYLTSHQQLAGVTKFLVEPKLHTENDDDLFIDLFPSLLTLNDQVLDNNDRQLDQFHAILFNEFFPVPTPIQTLFETLVHHNVYYQIVYPLIMAAVIETIVTK